MSTANSPEGSGRGPTSSVVAVDRSPDLDELRRLRRARDRMDREFDQPLDVAALAHTALMSSGHFSRRFRDVYAETPYAYLQTRRIERATALLRLGWSVTDACFAVGYASLGSFSRRFTELVGETPSAYRDRDHDGMEVIPRCRVMLLTRPRRQRPSSGTESISSGQARGSGES